MSGDAEFRCFVSGLSMSTSEQDLKEAFEMFGNVLEAKVVRDKDTGCSRGFGFVTYDEKKAMEDAIKNMDDLDIVGQHVNVKIAEPRRGSARARALSIFIEAMKSLDE